MIVNIPRVRIHLPSLSFLDLAPVLRCNGLRFPRITFLRSPKDADPEASARRAAASSEGDTEGPARDSPMIDFAGIALVVVTTDDAVSTERSSLFSASMPALWD